MDIMHIDPIKLGLVITELRKIKSNSRKLNQGNFRLLYLSVSLGFRKKNPLPICIIPLNCAKTYSFVTVMNGFSIFVVHSTPVLSAGAQFTVLKP